MEKSLVYIAEDDKVTRFLLNRVLADFQQLEVQIFENAKLLMDECENQKPNVILMDVNMPEMDAYQFLDHYSISSEQFFLMLGAPISEEKMNWFKSQGCSAFVEKPITRGKLEVLF